MLERDGARLFNACALVGPTGLVANYRKIHLPFLGVDRFTTPGDRPFAVHDLGGLRVGMTICYDGSFPESARVLMLQFLKGSWHYGELDAVQAFGEKFVMKQMGRGFVKVGAEKPDPEDVRMVEEAWNQSAEAILSGQWDVVILDEINYAISYGMLDPGKVAETLRKKPEMVHVILTGRNAHPTIIDLADTVTEMRQVKHAYEKGVMAQRGIEY